LFEVEEVSAFGLNLTGPQHCMTVRLMSLSLQQTRKRSVSN